MRHKYTVKSLVLARYPVSEANADIVLLTTELGLVYARAQGVRKSGAKLAAALQTLSESDVVLLRGREGWRITGAVLEKNRFMFLSQNARKRFGHVAGLLLRMMPRETQPVFYQDMNAFLKILEQELDDMHSVAEYITVLRLVHFLGFDAGEVPEMENGEYSVEILTKAKTNRKEYVARINHGISISGL